MKIVSVFSRKGGVAKTTTAANVAAALAAAGDRVLAVDADSQGHLAIALGVDRVPLFSSWAMGGDLLSLDVVMDQPTLPASWTDPASVAVHVALVAGDNESLRIDLTPAEVDDLAGRLRKEAAALGADWVIIDSPAIGCLQDFAVKAADIVILPAPCHFLGASGALDARALVRALNPSAQVLGLPTMYDRRLRDGRHWFQTLGAHFGEMLPAIPMRVAVAESLAIGLPVVLNKPADPAGQAYLAVADGLRAARLLEVA